MKYFAAILAFAAFVAAEENANQNQGNYGDAEQTAEPSKMFDPAYDTLTGVMVNYGMNGYDWPLTCQTGEKQSPVNLTSGFASHNTKLAIRAKGFENISAGRMKKGPTHMSLDISQNGQFDMIDPMGEYTEYTPYEVVVRSPSEHTVDGLTYDLELQFMFKKKGGASENTVAGMSIFFDGVHGGRMKNEFIESLLMKRQGARNVQLDALQRGESWPVTNVQVPKLLESMAESTYWTYEGSLTTPPCTEGVRWTIFEKVLPLETSQAIAIREHFNYNRNWNGFPNGNNRGTQPLNRRYIYYGGAQALVAGATALAAVYLF